MLRTGWQAVVRAVYGALLWLATPLYLLRLWRRGRSEPGYREHLAERLGRYAEPAPAPGALWLHAVSLGEARAALPLVEALRRHRPGLRMLFTHGTATGRSAGQRLMQPGDLQAWLPYDTPGAVQRFVRHFRPSVGVLMETEIWPVLLHEAQRAGVPMVLANARLSERSAAKGARLGALLHPAAARLASVLAQTPDDAERLRAAGALTVKVVGNLKFDMTPPPMLLARGLQWRRALNRPVVMMASSREGEEEPLLDDWAALPRPRPLLLLVPRHPQRFDMVASLVFSAGLTLARRSRWVNTPPDDAYGVDVWLGDTVGEMPLYYACADVALLGGSFEPLGGQNLIEAAACGCPVVMGPHTFNFAQAAWHAEQCGAARRVASLQQGVDVAVMAVQDMARNQWVDRALGFAAAHRGAADEMASEVLALAGPPYLASKASSASTSPG
ncbi:3-deoxy-D-manno-octulosonic acid transferase [Aquabacterium sp. OR-4]|uniref:3-deoxy-D-manno-octulosonic acid transferase n=1 Tax=Aquabacterium sp. OR-4 TaxID=2978127 RepID=UPI0021B37FB1|nr:3-deoxy-D-manno-octulosonic acid transferase [Aquabacterium sp. OR-4]MDT7834812.1 3-deoxy-D-manno-octulosonic acid transferase [Aquabacterium sp. OR-4]